MFSCDKNVLSELVLTAVFFMQQKNGVSAMEITEYVAEKRHCDPCKIRGLIKSVLVKAKGQGILCESQGLYRIQPKYEDELDKKELLRKKEDECEGYGKGAAKDECIALDIDGINNGRGASSRHPKEQDCDVQREGQEEDDLDDDVEFGRTSPDGLNPMEEPLPKKRKVHDKIQDDRAASDDDENEEWAKYAEKKLWNLSKTL